MNSKKNKKEGHLALVFCFLWWGSFIFSTTEQKLYIKKTNQRGKRE
jgi:hypothetical protein